MEQTDIAWLAGFIDGEGCIRVAKTSPGNYVLIVDISQKDREVLREIQSKWGGTMSSHRGGGGECSNLHISKSDAYPLLQQVLPYLHLKQHQAALALYFQDYKNRRGRVTKSNPRTPRDLELYEGIYQRIKIAHHTYRQ